MKKGTEFPELEGKEPNWLKSPKDSLYNLHLDELIEDPLKLVTLKRLIDELVEDIHGRQTTEAGHLHELVSS